MLTTNPSDISTPHISLLQLFRAPYGFNKEPKIWVVHKTGGVSLQGTSAECWRIWTELQIGSQYLYGNAIPIKIVMAPIREVRKRD